MLLATVEVLAEIFGAVVLAAVACLFAVSNVVDELREERTALLNELWCERAERERERQDSHAF